MIDMIGMLISVAFIMIAVVFFVMSMTIKHLSREVEVINFELSLLRRQNAEHEHRLTEIENELDCMRYYNVKKMVNNEQNI